MVAPPKWSRSPVTDERHYGGLIAMSPRRFAQMTALAVTYVIVAHAGLLFDAESGFATLVWPPTGIDRRAVARRPLDVARDPDRCLRGDLQALYRLIERYA